MDVQDFRFTTLTLTLTQTPTPRSPVFGSEPCSITGYTTTVKPQGGEEKKELVSNLKKEEEQFH